MTRAALALALPLLASCVGGAVREVAPAAPAPVERPAPRPVATAPRVSLEGSARQGGLVRGVAGGVAALTLDGVVVPVAPDGRFVVAFDRDAAPAALLRATGPDGQVAEQRLVVVPGAWRIEAIDAPLRAGRTSEQFAALRPAELAAIMRARATDTGAQGWRQPFRWPATGRRSGQFGAQRVYRGEPGSYHSGTDVAAPTGTPVLAPADGVVVLATARPFTLEGNLVIVDHGMGLNSAFLHLSRVDVAEGQRVAQGDAIGRVGATGRVTGPHLHWAMKWREARIDPALLAGAMRD